MSEGEAQAAAQAEPLETYADVIESFRGKVATVSNPESFEDTPMGYTITSGFYRAKILHVGTDYVTMAVEFIRRKGNVKESVKSFIPLTRIKRVTVTKQELLIHL